MLSDCRVVPKDRTVFVSDGGEAEFRQKNNAQKREGAYECRECFKCRDFKCILKCLGVENAIACIAICRPCGGYEVKYVIKANL